MWGLSGQRVLRTNLGALTTTRTYHQFSVHDNLRLFLLDLPVLEPFLGLESGGLRGGLPLLARRLLEEARHLDLLPRDPHVRGVFAEVGEDLAA